MSETLIVPKHIGLILDGNRRWARENGLSTLEGHRIGYHHLKDIVREAINVGVEYVSAYIFSIENWNRTKAEVKYLMEHALIFLTSDVAELNREGVRVVWLGTKERLSSRLLEAIDKAEESTRHNTKGTLGICFNYTGKQEIVDAAKQLIDTGVKSDQLTLETFERALYAPDVPPIDLLIRTSGEQRLSGFMLWRAAYAELLFVDKHWPEFEKADLHAAIEEYAARERRHGA